MPKKERHLHLTRVIFVSGSESRLHSQGDIRRTYDSSVEGESEGTHAAGRDQVNGPKEAEFATHDINDFTVSYRG